jgi:hypothetical protein
MKIMTHEKRIWETPNVQSLSVKGITLSGSDPAPNEAVGSKEFTPKNQDGPGMAS